jgi:hypothetical protein
MAMTNYERAIASMPNAAERERIDAIGVHFGLNANSPEWAWVAFNATLAARIEEAVTRFTSRFDAAGEVAGGEVEEAARASFTSSVSDLVSDARAEFLDRVVRNGPDPNHPAWLLFEGARRIERAAVALAEICKQNAGILGELRELGAEIQSTARALAVEREERLGKLIEPITALTAAVVQVVRADDRAAGARAVEAEATNAIRGLGSATEKALGVTSQRVTWLPVASFVAQLALAGLLVYALLAHRL